MLLICSLIYFNLASSNCPKEFDIQYVEEITDEQFMNCADTIGHDLTISAIVKKLGRYSFYGCTGITGKLTICMRNGIVEKSAFQGCTGIKEVSFNCNTVYGVSENSFYGCSGIESVTFPTSMQSIGKSAFSQCTSLSNPITLPLNLIQIGDYAFFNCTKIPEITIVLESARIGKFAFSYCSSIKSFQFKSFNIDDGAFSYCTSLESLIDFQNLKQISGKGVFMGCIGLVDPIEIPSQWKSIPSDTFAYCSNLGGIVFHENIEEIKDRAFYQCYGLKHLNILSNSIKIGIEAFCECSQLRNIENFDKITEIKRGAFQLCSNFNLPLNFNENIKEIPSYLFYECTKLNGPLVINENLNKIGSYAFYGCSNLRIESDLHLTNVKSIGDFAFYCCSNLDAKIIFSDDISSIGYCSFFNCSKLKGQLTIKGNGDLSIDDFAFYGCTGFEGELLLSQTKFLGNECFGLTNFDNILYYGLIGPSCNSIGNNIDAYVPVSYKSNNFCNNPLIKDIPVIYEDCEYVMELEGFGKNGFTNANIKKLAKYLQINAKDNSSKLLVYHFASGYGSETNNGDELEFNNQMEPNQFIKFDRYLANFGIYIYYYGGNLNILDPSNQIISNGIHDYYISILGGGKLILEQERDTLYRSQPQIIFWSNSTIDKDFQIELHSSYKEIKSISIKELTLMDKANIKPCVYGYTPPIKLEINKLTIEPYSDVTIESAKINGSFIIKHNAKVNLKDVELENADIIYQMSPYKNKDGKFSNTIFSNPNSFIIKEADEPKRNMEKEYILIDSYFDCPNWDISIDPNSKYLDRFECIKMSDLIDHYQLKLYTKKDIPTFDNPDDNNSGKEKNNSNKLSTGALIGIIVGCVVFVAALMVAEYFIVARCKSRKDASNNEAGNEEI